jgi:hypothetical protein
MNLLNLIAEIQYNPRSQNAYRLMAQHFRAVSMSNEADAFEYLIREKFHGFDGTHRDEEQPGDGTEDDRIDPASPAPDHGG